MTPKGISLCHEILEITFSRFSLPLLALNFQMAFAAVLIALALLIRCLPVVFVAQWWFRWSLVQAAVLVSLLLVVYWFLDTELQVRIDSLY